MNRDSLKDCDCSTVKLDLQMLPHCELQLNISAVYLSMLDLLMDYGSNIEHYSKIQAYLRAYAYPALLLWGEYDQYRSPEAAHAYKRDLANAEIHYLDGGNWLLESHVGEVNAAVRNLLSTHLS